MPLPEVNLSNLRETCSVNNINVNNDENLVVSNTRNELINLNSPVQDTADPCLTSVKEVIDSVSNTNTRDNSFNTSLCFNTGNNTLSSQLGNALTFPINVGKKVGLKKDL